VEDLLRQDEYDLILSDPFAVMKEEEIINTGMNAPIAETALLFMWVPGKKLGQGLDVMREWGFQYVTSACWIDDKLRLDKNQLKKDGHYYVIEDPTSILL
jgi:N6-adenosine-specific RNA methylase IME4